MNPINDNDADDAKPTAKPNAKAPLGQGGRFAALQAALSKAGAASPGGLAAAIGRRKFGRAKFQQMAAKGKK